jgi:hypothetical protein
MSDISLQNVSMEGYMEQLLDSHNRMFLKIDEIQGHISGTSVAVASSQQTYDALASRTALAGGEPAYMCILYHFSRNY